jgi:hypothetical protein
MLASMLVYQYAAWVGLDSLAPPLGEGIGDSQPLMRAAWGAAAWDGMSGDDRHAALVQWLGAAGERVLRVLRRGML